MGWRLARLVGLRQAAISGSIVALAVIVVAAMPAGATLPQQGGSITVEDAHNQQFVDSADPGDADAGGRPRYVGDVNGDGIGDFAVGDPDATNPATGTRTGAVYVVFGRSGVPASPIDLTSAGLNGYVIYGASTGDQFGASLDGAGDINGDGHADLVIGAPGAGSGSGAAYVVYGQSADSAVDAGSLGARGYAITDAGAGAELGFSVAGLGDVSGDGVPDVAVGAPGRSSSAGAVFLVAGQATPVAVDLSGVTVLVSTTPYHYAHATGWAEIVGGTAQQLGLAVAGLGDFSGDGKRDLAFDGAVGGSDSTGVVRIPYLPDDLTLAPAQGTSISGPPGSGLSVGFAIAGAGDFNADGRADVVVTAPNYTYSTFTDAGAAWIVYGRTDSATLETDTLAGTDALIVTGSATGEQFGHSVAGLGDINGDGDDDVVIGSPFAIPDSYTAHGRALVLYGVSGDDDASSRISDTDVTGSDGSLGFAINGDDDGQQAGELVGGGGDVTGDGRPDVLVDVPMIGGDPGVWKISVVSGFGTPALAYPVVAGRVGTPLSVAPATFSRTGAATITPAASLPAGLSVDSATGVISGTPRAAGMSTAVLNLVDDASSTATTVSFSIAAAGPTGPSGPTGSTGPTGRGGPPPGSGRPVIRGLKVSPHRFAVGRGRTAVQASGHRKRPPIGAKITASVSVPATVTFTITSAKRLRCARKRPRCRRSFSGKLVRTTAGGTLKLRFSGRVGSRALPAGSYRITAVAVGLTDRRSTLARSTFAVVAR
jgi:hypothetical protein